MSEETRSCNLVVNSDSKEISISGLASEDFSIGYGGDIDLTGLVMSFAKLIDTGELVSLVISNDEVDEKLLMVLATIEDIANAYNASLEVSSDEGSNLPESSDEDDFPF